MIDLVSFIRDEFFHPGNAVLLILIFIAAIKGLYDGITWAREELDKWYKARYMKDEEKENLESRIAEVERINSEQSEKYASIEQTLENINTKLDDLSNDMKDQSTRMIRNTLLRIWNEVKEKGYITQAQSETFEGLAEIYLKYNGNGFFKNEVIPQVRAMEIKD